MVPVKPGPEQQLHSNTCRCPPELGSIFTGTCFCLVIKSQSSTSHGFSSSGIFTFTSTLFINVSSWEKPSQTNYSQVLIGSTAPFCFAPKIPGREWKILTLSTVGSTRALFFLGGWGVSLVLLPSPMPGAVHSTDNSRKKQQGTFRRRISE